MLFRRTVLLLLATFVGLAGVEQAGDTAYLARKLRPEWRLVSLQSALDEIAKAAERPVERSARVLEQQKEPVVLVARQRLTLEEILVALERTHALRVSAGPLRIAVESERDARDRRRRPVQINLDEFAVGTVFQDQPARALGRAGGSAPSSGGGFDIYKGVEVAESTGADPADVLELLVRHGEEATMEMRASVAHLLVTPEEESLMRAVLQEHYQISVRRGIWRATFGLLPAGEALATGVVAPEVATALAARLQQRSELTVAAFNNQTGHAGALRQQALISDAEVVNEMLDPSIEALATGRQFQVRAIRGTSFDTLDCAFNWVEPMPVRESPIRLPASAQPGAASMRSEVQKEQTTTSASVAAAVATAGQRAALQLPAVWSWTPHGDVALPRGQALVLCAPHGEHSAVIICAEVR